MTLTPFLTAYLLTLTGILGLCTGSFLMCLSARTAEGESVLKGRSRCDACGHELRLPDLVPVFSYLFLKGKCRYCGTKIPAGCVWAEIVSCATFVSIAARYGFSLETAELLLFACALLWMSFTDLETMNIPTGALLMALVVRIAYLLGSGAGFKGMLSSMVYGLAIGLPLLFFVLLYEKLRKKEAMGGGDIKLFFVIGTYFDWKINILILIVACVLGILGAVIAQSVKRQQGGKPFPFGPAIATAAWCAMLVGQPMMDWYLGLFL